MTRFPSAPMTSHSIRFQSVTLEIQPWHHPAGRDYWRAYWHDPSTGKRQAITRATLKAAKGKDEASAWFAIR